MFSHPTDHDGPALRHLCRRRKVAFSLLPVLLLGACVAEAPTGPSIPVMPGEGKSLGQFQQDDATCRQFANQQTGGASPGVAANQSAVGSTVVGTLLGAAAGAAFGAAAGDPAAGAAIGAGAGLLTGAAVGTGNAAYSGESVQQRYDIAYEQCMTTTGNNPVQVAAPQPAYTPPPPAPAPVYVAPAYPAYPYYYYPGYYYPGYYYPGPYYYGPGFYPQSTFVFSFHGGDDHHGYHGYNGYHGYHGYHGYYHH